MRSALVGLASLWMGSCGAAGRPPPVELDTGKEQCRSCRMAVSDQRTAAQIVSPSEEPLFFDDVGCLRNYLEGGASLPAGAVAYVADHRTKAWIGAAKALYTRNASIDTPMGSHLLAHADAASREADPDARAGTPLSPAEVFGPSGPPDGSPER